MAGRKKSKLDLVVRSYVVTTGQDKYLQNVSDEETITQDRDVSKSETLRSIIKEHKDQND